jgi:excinuclease ABC subunit A
MVRLAGARRDEAPGEPRIEHTRKREVIKTVDWVLDLGPEGGDKGGEIVAEGTQEQVAEEARSYTGGYLKELLAKSVRAHPKSAIGRKKRGSASSIREREAAE